MRDDHYAVRITNLKKVYRTGSAGLTVLDGTNLNVKKGTIIAVMGRSGSGKTTLLNLVGGLDRPSSGSIIVKDTHFENAPEEELSRIRNSSIGFVFQFHNLLSEFSVLENVMMPSLLRQFNIDRARHKALEILSVLEIEDKLHAKPGMLSGGESQRVAIARALVNDPEIVLADEPTGNLDLKTSEKIKRVLFDIVHRYGHTLMIVTHNASVVEDADETYVLKGGTLIPLIEKNI